MVTRFPPEPSGYLHIGHARAIYINYYLAKVYSRGKFILRFDDTNPKTESLEYVQAIKEDLQTLGIVPDQITYSSSYFPALWDLVEKLVADGHAYVDPSTQEEMQQQRANLKPSPYRDAKLVLDNESLGVVRLKLDPSSANGCLRDPTIYRRVDGTWFPTYDFTCPVVDYLEGITHVFRDTNYSDRDPQYREILKLVKAKVAQLCSFGRINFQGTIISKRHMKEQINLGNFSGWDDPRLPTLRGLLRRGLSVAGLQAFIYGEGLSKNVIDSTFAKLWTINRKIIDKEATRYQVVPVNSPAYDLTLANRSIKRFDRQPSLGERVLYGPNGKIYLEEKVENQEIFALLNLAVFRLMGTRLELLVNIPFSEVPNRLTWVSDYRPVFITRIVDHQLVIVPYWGEEALKEVQVGQYIQLLKFGYYRVDRHDDTGLYLIELS